MVEPERIKELNDAPEADGEYVLYWMQQSQRADFNPALETAVGEANRLALPVVVGFGLTDKYPEANARHYAFMLEGLRDVRRALAERGVAFIVQQGRPDEVAIKLARRAALVVCDRGYLRHQKIWRKRLAEEVNRRVVQVEGDVVVPVGLASQKQEFAARTLRPKLLSRRDEFLKPLRKKRNTVTANKIKLPASLDFLEPRSAAAKMDIDQSVAPVSRFLGGAVEARRRLKTFLRGPLENYAEQRGEPAAEQVSFLGAYLHFGQISPVEIALAVAKSGAAKDSRASYLDELIIRRELAVNFVEYAPDYDSYSCLPEWAQRTLRAHRGDHRPHTYTASQFDQGKTHDPYWNAAMAEMRVTGYMHNHMRMYWAKKILEWSTSPEKAFATALALNNKYFLCGRDPNSYANIAWCFGLHDRPWPERAIFGKVRSMTAGGLERKTDVDAYLRRVEELCRAEQ